MLKKQITLILLCIAATTFAQTYEVGVVLGASNFVGDIGSTTIVKPKDAGFGVIGKWNRSPRHSFRFSALYIPVSGDDLASSDPSRQQRAFKFKNAIKELSLGIEYTFWEFDLHKGEKQISPYLYTGITGFSYNALARKRSDNSFATYNNNKWSMAIPIVLGIKTNLGSHIVVGFELGARYTFTDNIDGSNPEGLNLPSSVANLNFGNLNNNDWYFFNALTLTYAFGRKPCYCGF